MTPHERPKRAADFLGFAVLLGGGSIALLTLAGMVSDGGDDATGLIVAAVVAALAATYCLMVGVHRLAAHADRAALRAYDAERNGEGDHRDDGSHDGWPRQATRS